MEIKAHQHAAAFALAGKIDVGIAGVNGCLVGSGRSASVDRLHQFRHLPVVIPRQENGGAGIEPGAFRQKALQPEIAAATGNAGAAFSRVQRQAMARAVDRVDRRRLAASGNRVRGQHAQAR